MKTYSLPRRSGATLLRDAATHAKQERDGRDLLVVDIAEIDARRVYREAGYRSTLAYCMEKLELSEKAITEGKSKEEIRQLVRERFPRRNLFTAATAPSSEPLLLGPVEAGEQHRPDGVVHTAAPKLRPDGVGLSAPAIQLPPERFPLKTSLRRETHEKLRRAKELLGPGLPQRAAMSPRKSDALLLSAMAGNARS